MRIRAVLVLATVVAGVTLLAGCAASEPAGPPVPTEPPTTEPSTDPVATWLDDGRAIALVTWGSSSTACTPAAGDVQADGQTISVTFTEPPADIMCTADFVPRASYIAVPKGVDPAQDVTLSFQGAGFDGRVPLFGDAELKGTAAQGTPSAGWFAPDGIVLLTWGSSSCPPVVENIVDEKGGATITFQTDPTKMCTRDFVPRLTVLNVAVAADPADYVLHLSGDNLDGTVTVIG